MFIDRSIFVGVLFLFLLADPANAFQRQGNPEVSQTSESPAPTPILLPVVATPETMARQPKISFKNGMLTVVAENSTLRDVLTAIQTKAGVVVDMPPDLDERVVVQLGPGHTREILTSLMNGGRFNYIMLSSAERPDEISRLILTPRQETVAELAPRQNVVRMSPIVAPPPPTADDGAETAANTVLKKGDPDDPSDSPAEPETPQ